MPKGHRGQSGPKIKEILDGIPLHPYLLLYEDMSIHEVKKCLVKIEVVRNIYVLNPRGQLIGYLSLGRLIRYLTAIRRGMGLQYHALLEFVSARTVRDLMEEDVVYAVMEDLAEDVLEKMIEREIKEVPVLNNQRKVIGNIGLLDLWRYTERSWGE